MESYVPSSSPLTAEELTAYIGPRAERYARRFARFTRTGATRFEFSWNNPAAFLGLWWYLYRKMYGWALVDFVLSVLLGWTLFVPILWASPARSRATTSTSCRPTGGSGRPARSPPPSMRRREHPAPRPARRRGGVNRWVAWVAVALAFLLLAILLFAFNWIWSAIPPLRDLWPDPPGRWT